jgi:hypothetical protein
MAAGAAALEWMLHTLWEWRFAAGAALEDKRLGFK